MSRKIAVIGGGVIGLSIAYELSKRCHSVVLFERESVGRQASWAGAGILPPTEAATAIHSLEKLESLSHGLHKQWAAELKSLTGIDNGFCECGGLYVARTRGEKAALHGQMLLWDQRQIVYEEWKPAEFASRIPALTLPPDAKQIFVPGEHQLRNPRHLQALLQACLKNGVEVREHVHELELVVRGAETEFLLANGERVTADQYCIACGAWSENLVRPFGVPLPSTPVRGQMALFKLRQPEFTPVVNEGTRYLVPRDDGHVLVGATIEEVGFDCRTVDEDIAELAAWAGGLMPHCNSETLVTAWAGLRPGTYDGFPYLGSIGQSTNSWVASGHFKAGLHLSTGTAVMMADLMEGKPATIDLTPFAPSRAEFHLAQPIS
jgi:glycine oxidase